MDTKRSNIAYLVIGTYTKEESEGIYVYKFDIENGDSECISRAQVENPSFITVSEDEKYIYSVSENEDRPSFVNAFSFDKETGEIKYLNQEATYGGGACYINIDEKRTHVITANYAGGTISILQVNQNGTVCSPCQLIQFEGKGIVPERQDSPHIHCVVFSPKKEYLFATDLGTDKVYRFDVNLDEVENYIAENSKKQVDVPVGSGPRHLIFHPSHRYAYLVNELSGTVIAFTYNDGELTAIQETEANISQGQSGGDLDISPDGRFLYVSSRLENDGVMIFSINQENGKLSKVDYRYSGIHPRYIKISPDGNFLLVANRDTDNIQIFSRDKETGKIDNIHKDIKVSMPVCMVFI